MDDVTDEMVSTCEAAARAAGKVLLEWRGRFTVREKGPADLVTEADVAAQATIHRIVMNAFPTHGFLGEEALAEQKPTAASTNPFCWIVDPLDGTTNYVHDLPGWAVSIALAKKDKVQLGCVYDPVGNDLYMAIAGQGAFRNGVRMRTSATNNMSEALVAVSFSASVKRNSPEVERFLEVMVAAQGFRRLGSAAMNLCHVAGGQLDAYYATSVKAWDVAAGALLVEEAGGTLSSLSGKAFDVFHPRIVAAANPGLHRELLTILARVA